MTFTNILLSHIYDFGPYFTLTYLHLVGEKETLLGRHIGLNLLDDSDRYKKVAHKLYCHACS